MTWLTPEQAAFERATLYRDYCVTFKDIEGPAWTKTFRAMGPNDAANLAREYARDEGEDVRVIKVVTA